MAVNVLQPQGLIYSRQKGGGAPNIALTQFTIKKGFGSAIGKGDLVVIGTGGNQGYITPCGNNPAAITGIFVGVQPYFDLTFQQNVHGGLNGSYQTTANPAADIPCWVMADQFAVFRIQVTGGPFAQSWVGNNINFLANSNGVPGTNGLSTLSVDGTTSATTNTLPFRVEAVSGVSGGPQDPANTNPWIEVSINPAILTMLQGTGI